MSLGQPAEFSPSSRLIKGHFNHKTTVQGIKIAKRIESSLFSSCESLVGAPGSAAGLAYRCRPASRQQICEASWRILDFPPRGGFPGSPLLQGLLGAAYETQRGARARAPPAFSCPWLSESWALLRSPSRRRAQRPAGLSAGRLQASVPTWAGSLPQARSCYTADASGPPRPGPCSEYFAITLCPAGPALMTPFYR